MHAGPGALVPNFRLTDHRGVTRELYYESTVKAVVLVSTTPDSPRALQTAAALRAKARRARFDRLLALDRELLEARRLVAHPLNARLVAENLMAAYNRATLG